MTDKAVRRDITALVLAGLLALVAVPTPGPAQTATDTNVSGQTVQRGGQVAPADDDDDDGMELGWLGLLGLAGLLGLRRRDPDPVQRVDPRPTTRP